MNFIELKELAKKLGGILVMSGNVPEFVILSYANYHKLEDSTKIEDHKSHNDIQVQDDAIEKLNREISSLKEEIRQKEEAELLQSSEENLDNQISENLAEESSPQL